MRAAGLHAMLDAPPGTLRSVTARDLQGVANAEVCWRAMLTAILEDK